MTVLPLVGPLGPCVVARHLYGCWPRYPIIHRTLYRLACATAKSPTVAAPAGIKVYGSSLRVFIRPRVTICLVVRIVLAIMSWDKQLPSWPTHALRTLHMALSKTTSSFGPGPRQGYTNFPAMTCGAPLHHLRGGKKAYTS